MDLHAPCRGRKRRQVTISGYRRTHISGFSKEQKITPPAGTSAGIPTRKILKNLGNAIVRFSGVSDQ